MANINGYMSKKESGYYYFVLPIQADIKDAYDSALEFIDLLKKENDKILAKKKEEEEKSKDKVIDPETK